METNALSIAVIWEIAANRLKRRNMCLFEQWFSKIVPLSVEDSKVRLGVTDEFFAMMIEDNYDDILSEALSNLEGVDYTWEFVPGHEPVAGKTIVSKTVSEAPSAAPAVPKQEKSPLPRRNCLPEYTFENFVVGAENRPAFVAARNAAETPGVYNPLYIFGGSGVGKTHLLHAVANAARKQNPGMVVRYATCDELLNDFYDLLQQKKSLSEFREIRNVDMLLVDDVHSLAKKNQMQEEFFNLFNALYNQGKQIILTSDKQPCEISDLDKRLVTRFESGMTAELGVPEFEARLAILRMMRNEMLTKNKLDDEFLEFLAANISSSVRRLKGAFYRLTCYTSSSGNDKLTIAEAEDLLRIQLDQENQAKDISVEAIQRAVATHFGVTFSDLLGKERTRTIAEPRMIAMYLCRELTENSTNEIGAAFGKNHATILHAEKQVPKLCENNDAVRRAVSTLKRQLQHK